MALANEADEKGLSELPEPVRLSLLGVDFYHGRMNRHYAETLLRHNGVVGTYMMRLGTEKPESLVLSVRGSDANYHFRIEYEQDRKTFTFGPRVTQDFTEIVDFIRNFPTLHIGQNNAITLQFPYPCQVAELSLYEDVHVHQDGTSSRSGSISLDLAASGKQGWLTKQGQLNKNWKLRWFVLDKNLLKYYKDRKTLKPKGTINLHMCHEVSVEEHPEFKNVFSVISATRKLLMFANTAEEKDEWVNILKWRVDSYKRERSASFSAGSVTAEAEQEEDDDDE